MSAVTRRRAAAPKGPSPRVTAAEQSSAGSSTATPSSRSSFYTVLVTAGWVRPRAWAARQTLPSRATATIARSR